jgi:hypothetical protein
VSADEQPPCPLNDRLAELGRDIASARVRGRDLQMEHGRIAEEVEALRESIIESYAEEDSTAATKARKRRVVAEGRLRDVAERVEGAQRAALKAEAARGVFAAENADRLEVELQPDLEALHTEATEWLATGAVIQKCYDDLQGKVALIRRLAGKPTEDLRGLPEPFAALARQARRAAPDDVPSDVPSSAVR